MTSFFAQSFEFFSDKPESVCAFLAATRPIFNSSIIPVTLNTEPLWNAFWKSTNGKHKLLLQIFLLSDTLQFSPSLMLYKSDDSFTLHLLRTLIHERRYFCRTLKRFGQVLSCALLALVYVHVPSLETLTCSISGIDDWQPIVRFTRLRELNLQFSDVTDEDLQHFAGLTSLQKLSFRDNYDITGSGFKSWSGKLKSLRVLELFELSRLSDAGLLCLPELPSLVQLSLTRYYSIAGVGFSAAVMKQKSLRILKLNFCSFSSEGLKGLRELPALTDLDVSRSARFDDECLSVLASIQGSLRRLSLAYCSLISDEGVTMLVNEMKDLVFLDLSNCQAVTDSSLKAISNLQYLVQLRIAYLPLLSDEGIHFLKNCPRLSTVSFGDQNYATSRSVTDLSLEAFSQMKSLITLLLHNEKTFSDDGVTKLADSKSLERFELHGENDVTNDAMLSLSKSTALRMIKIKRGSQMNKGALRFFQGTKIHVEINETYH